jgi:RsiW-degrading membrane proteinase PrsW (M82 family)
MNELHVTIGERTYSFGPGDTVRIGRSPDNDIVVSDPTVSRQHAELTLGPDGWQFHNVGRALSFLDGEPVSRTLLSGPVAIQLSSAEGPVLEMVPLPGRPPLHGPGAGLGAGAALAAGAGLAGDAVRGGDADPGSARYDWGDYRSRSAAPDYPAPDYASPAAPDYATPDYASPDYATPAQGGQDYRAPDYQDGDYRSPGYPAPDSPAAGYAAPDSPAGGYAAPDSPAGGYAAPDSPAGGYAAPEYPAPEYPTPDYAGPDYASPAQGGQDYQSPGYQGSDSPAAGYAGPGDGQDAGYGSPSYRSPDYPAPDYPFPDPSGYASPSGGSPSGVSPSGTPLAEPGPAPDPGPVWPSSQPWDSADPAAASGDSWPSAPAVGSPWGAAGGGSSWEPGPAGEPAGPDAPSGPDASAADASLAPGAAEAGNGSGPASPAGQADPAAPGDDAGVSPDRTSVLDRPAADGPGLAADRPEDSSYPYGAPLAGAAAGAAAGGQHAPYGPWSGGARENLPPRVRAVPAPPDGEIATALHILVPLRSWLHDPDWKQFTRLLVIPYGLLPLIFIALFASSNSLSTPGWAYSLYIAPLWGIVFWLLIKPGQIGKREIGIGVGAIVFALIWIKLVTVHVNELMGTAGKPLSFPGAIGVGINEEITKALPILIAALLLLRYRDTKLDVRMWMFLGTIVGLAFGVTEQAGYTLQDIQGIASAQGNSQAIVDVLAFAERVFVDGFQHAMWAGVSAFFIGMAVNYPRRRLQLIAFGIGVPALLHGLYDWSAGAFASLWVPIIIQLISLFLFLGYTMSAAAIERQVRQTPMFRGESMLMERIHDTGQHSAHAGGRAPSHAVGQGLGSPGQGGQGQGSQWLGGRGQGGQDESNQWLGGQGPGQGGQGQGTQWLDGPGQGGQRPGRHGLGGQDLGQDQGLGAAWGQEPDRDR